jgi:hypothetical protein
MKDYVRDNILDIAKKNAKNVKIISNNRYDLDDVDNENIYFKFYKNNNFDYKSKDYLRKETLLNILRNNIIPSLKLNKDFNVNINLHDYHDNSGSLSFGAKKNNSVALIPDIYQMENYKDSILYGRNDETHFTNKINKIVFCGASTGSIKPENNDRINTCIWSIKNPWAVNNSLIKLNNIVQINGDTLNNYLTENKVKLSNIMSKHISIDKQLAYKYILSIDGNTWAWDRPIWIMSSNSLFFKYESENVGWYYELLKEDVHYVSVNRDNMEKKYNFFENNTNQALEIIYNSQKFVDDYCSKESWEFYFKSLLEEISYQNN